MTKPDIPYSETGDCSLTSRLLRFEPGHSPARNLPTGDAVDGQLSNDLGIHCFRQRQGQRLDVNNLLYRRIHLDLRRTASSACLDSLSAPAPPAR
jgi:hypothetical protein